MTENDTSLPTNQRGEWDVILAGGGVPGGGQGGASPTAARTGHVSARPRPD